MSKFKVGDKVRLSAVGEGKFFTAGRGYVGEVVQGNVSFIEDPHPFKVLWNEHFYEYHPEEDLCLTEETNDMKVKYDFSVMDVNREYLLESISGNRNFLSFSFYWDGTPQGSDYWNDQHVGEKEIQVDVLKDMLEQYDAWIENQKDSKNDTSEEGVLSDGGPSAYYDFLPEWVTFNDWGDYKAKTQWLEHSFHLGNIGKVLNRWGNKAGTTKLYDTKKIIYSGLRVMVMLEGKEKAREYLEKLLNDNQFKG